MAERLLSAGADPNPDFPLNSLTAASLGAEPLVKIDMLLDAGVDINTRMGGLTPLLQAIRSASPEVVEHLLSRGADPEIRLFGVSTDSMLDARRQTEPAEAGAIERVLDQWQPRTSP